MKAAQLLLLAIAGCFTVLPEVRAEDWQVVWKDDMQKIQVDRDSIQVNGAQVEYWYSDTVDAIVDQMEHRFHAVSDCANQKFRLIEVYEPPSGQTHAVKESGWKDMPYNPNDPVTVMHYEVCRDFGREALSSAASPANNTS